jgi:hypothetical protein
VYEDETSCSVKSLAAQQPIPLESGIINKAQIDVKPSTRPRFWYVQLSAQGFRLAKIFVRRKLTCACRYVVLANCQAAKLEAKVKTVALLTCATWQQFFIYNHIKPEDCLHQCEVMVAKPSSAHFGSLVHVSSL